LAAGPWWTAAAEVEVDEMFQNAGGKQAPAVCRWPAPAARR